MKTEKQLQLEKAFMESLRGIPSYTVAQAVGRQTPGVIYTGCSKTYLSERWAYAKTYPESVVAWPLVNVDFTILINDAKEMQAAKNKWKLDNPRKW